MATTASTQQELQAEALQMLHERDMRYFDATMVTTTIRTAGEQMRNYMREPLLDEQGAAALVDATERYAIPAWDRGDLLQFIYCAKLCPRKKGA